MDKKIISENKKIKDNFTIIYNELIKSNYEIDKLINIIEISIELMNNKISCFYCDYNNIKTESVFKYHKNNNCKCIIKNLNLLLLNLTKVKINEINNFILETKHELTDHTKNSILFIFKEFLNYMNKYKKLEILNNISSFDISDIPDLDESF